MMKRLSIMIASILASAGALAGAADTVSIDHPQVRLAPPNAPATAAFMVIRNGGDKEIRVVKAQSPVARVTELHTHLNDGGVMKMRPVSAIEIKARSEAVLKPGGMHVMLIDLKAPLAEGDAVPLTFTFDDGSSKTLDARVVRPLPTADEHRH